MLLEQEEIKKVVKEEPVEDIKYIDFYIVKII
jgi:hypothetical protein